MSDPGPPVAGAAAGGAVAAPGSDSTRPSFTAGPPGSGRLMFAQPAPQRAAFHGGAALGDDHDVLARLERPPARHVVRPGSVSKAKLRMSPIRIAVSDTLSTLGGGC